MVSNENYMSEVGTQQFQTFPICSLLLSSLAALESQFELFVASHSKNLAFGLSHCLVGAELTPHRHSVTLRKA